VAAERVAAKEAELAEQAKRLEEEKIAKAKELEE
jgi:hypothetical protein